MASTPTPVAPATPSGSIEKQLGSSSSDHAEIDDGAARTRIPFTRSTLFAILVVGVCAFTAPGIWSALNGLGVGGSQTPDLVNAANAILYGFMTVTCFLGPWITNALGFKWTLALGTVGYPLYAAGLYANNRNPQVTWFIYFGAVVCGISAGFFWSVEGAIATGYPENRKRGRYIATWFSFRNFGNIIGGSIALAVNHKLTRKGKVGYQTYQAFVAIQCVGFFAGLLLRNPQHVIRDDGTRIQAGGRANGGEPISWRSELQEMRRVLFSRPILLLTPLFWYFGWMQAYPGTYLATYFTVRSRALASFLSAVVGTLSTWLAGSLVDLPWVRSRKTRAIATFALIAVLNTATWIWAVIIQHEFQRTRPTLDWSNQSTFGRAFGVYMLERISLGLVENYIYWCIGQLSDAPGQQIRYSSVLRGIETAAVAVGFGVQAVPTILIATASINLGFWMIALPFGYYATLRVVRTFDEQENKQISSDEAVVQQS